MEDARDMLSIRDKVKKSKNDKDAWITVKRAISEEIKEAVRSLDKVRSSNIGTSSMNGDHLSSNLVFQAQIQPQQVQKSTSVCFHMRDSGSCWRGDHCRFSHDVSAIRQSRESQKFNSRKDMEARIHYNRNIRNNKYENDRCNNDNGKFLGNRDRSRSPSLQLV